MFKAFMETINNIDTRIFALVVVGLGLDDHARAVAVAHHAADQRLGDLDHRPQVERPW